MLILFTTTLFIDLEGLDKFDLSNCAISIMGFWVIMFMSIVVFRDSDYNHVSKWFLLHLTVLMFMLLAEFLRRAYTGKGVMELVSVYASFIMVLSCIFSFWFYIRIQVDDRGSLAYVNKAIILAYVLGLLLILSNILTGDLFYMRDGSCHRGSYQWATYVMPMVLIVLLLYADSKFKGPSGEKRVMYEFCLVPLLFFLPNLVNYPVSMTEFSLLVNVMIVFGYYYTKRGRIIEKQDLDLAVAKVNPHFIYNALGAIMNIEDNPPETREALLEFTTYLRANLNAMGSDRPIPIRKEMEIVEAYSSLEKLRFKNRFCAEYDIPASNFYVPALTVEVLVENAIKHGLLPKKEGGTVKVSFSEGEDGYTITVSDDGVGFDTALDTKDRSREHIGLDNVRERLRMMVGGTLLVESTPGVGTTCTVTIPKKS